MSTRLRPALRILAAAWLGSVLLGLLLAASSQAAWPGRNGAIVFAQEGPAPDTSDIRIFYPATGEGGLTATSQVEETDPTFSPNGRLIAYVRRKPGGQGDIWVMDQNGNNRRPVVEGEESELQPAFFPSGRSLVFSVHDGGSLWDVYSVRLDGSGLRLLVRRGSDPVISPDGRLLAYTRNGGGSGIRVRNLRSGAERQLTTGSAQQLEFSPDGRRLLFVGLRRCSPRNRDLRFAILKIGVKGGDPTFLRRSCEVEFAGGAWSPDGRRIVYARSLQEGRRSSFHLAMMTAGGAAVGGAPPHRRGTNNFFPTWQPLR